jgi:glycosyltransferase involved in cell wall biosynthesis
VLEPGDAALVHLFGENGPAIIYVSEITRQTQRKIIAIEVANPLRRWKRQIQAGRAERAKVAAVRASAGLQCNGLPTYTAYHDRSPNAMLFFDTRVRADLIISSEALTRRLDAMKTGGPLRIVFSGRLTAIKGVEDLPKLAHALIQLEVPFTLDVFGDGPLGPALEKVIARYRLEDRVRLRGALEFESQLVPELQAGADLFVCCHPQGDPSCTYLETMACGVPIAGYDNEAHAGLVRHARTGWATPIGDVQSLARQIRALNEDRSKLREASIRAREFASRHTLEATFDARVDHLIACRRAKRDSLGPGDIHAT